MKKRSLLSLSLVTAISLHASNTPNIGDVLKQVKPPKIKKEKRVKLPSLEQKQEALKSFDDSKKVFVKSIKLSGNEQLSTQALSELIAEYENRELSFNDIQEASSKLTKYYRQQGFFVARAYLPAQNILAQDGVLKITIIEGEYGAFKLENDSLVKDSIIQANLDDIKDENIVSTNTLERAMLIINDTPGVIVNKAEVRPGQELGTSDFIIGTQATNKYGGYVLVDNYGSLYTGKNRVMGGFDINSPFEKGDKLSFSALTSDEIGLLNGRIAYEFPILPNGLRGEASVSKTAYELGNIYSALDAIGYSDSLSFKASYPYIKSRLESLDLYSTISYNKMNDQIKSTNTKTEKNSYDLVVGLDYTKDYAFYNKNSQSRVNLSYTLGHLSFKDQADKALDEAGAKTNGAFSKINLELGQDFELNEKLRWENTLQAQYALGNKNLDGSQDLSLGGINGVRFYPDGEQSGENGYIFNTELFYVLPNHNGLSSTISAFYDVGAVKMSNNFSNEEYRTLQDLGIGYYGAYKDLFINAHFAKGIAHDVTSEKRYENRFMFQAGWAF